MTAATTPHESVAAEEAVLLARLRAGDEGAFEELVRGRSGVLLATARRMLGREEDAQDAVQEAFLSAFKGLDAFEGGSRVSTWLHRITINACLMKLRTRRRRPERAIEDLLPTFAQDGHQTRSSTPWKSSALEGMQQREVRDLVRGCIERLPEDFRVVLLLRDIEEVSTEEAGAYLGISAGAVKTRLHRARQALRTLLDPHFVEGGL